MQVGVVAVVLGQAELHVVVLADERVAEAADLLVAADHQAQRRADVAGVDAEVGGALAVDVDAELGLVELERRVGVDDAADLAGADLSRSCLAVLGERVEVRAADDEVDVEVAAADVERREVAELRAEVLELARAARRSSCITSRCE